jgi:hypothetical protein
METLKKAHIVIIFKYGEESEIKILFVIDIGNRGDIYK